MEIKVQKSEFLKGLVWTQGVVEKKSTMPILSSSLIEAKGKSVTFSATNLEVGVLSTIPCDVVKPGKVAADAKGLYDIVRELSDKDIVEIREMENNWIEVSCGRARFKIVGSNPGEFPGLPPNEGELYRLDAKTLLDMVGKTSYAMSLDETRYALNGVYIEGGDGKLRMVAADGHRLSYLDRPVKGKWGGGVIIPKRGVWEIKKMADTAAEEERDVSVRLGEKTVTLESDGVQLIIRLVDGRFPPYQQIIPKGNDKIVSVNKKELSTVLKRISLVANEKSRGVKLAISPGNLEISSSNPDVGEGVETLGCVYKEESFNIGFNARYLLDIIDVLEDELVLLELKNDTTPCVIRSEFDKGFLALIMPMRL